MVNCGSRIDQLRSSARLLLLVTFFSFAWPNTTALAEPDASEWVDSGPYCGLYCLYAVLNLYHRPVQVELLLKPEYVGSQEGSSIGELALAVEDLGLTPTVLAELTTKDLRKIHMPVILHVRARPESEKFDHYVLFLRHREGNALIYDPPNEPTWIPLYELPARWDGVGLVVSSADTDLSEVWVDSRRQLLVVVLMVLLLVATVGKWISNRLKPVNHPGMVGLLGQSVLQCGGLVLGVAIYSMAYNWMADEGFLVRSQQVREVQAASLTGFIPMLDAQGARAALNDGATFIDARRPEDFESGHVPGAISIPPDATSAYFRTMLSGLSAQDRLVIYCQNDECPYSSRTAKKLYLMGFSNPAIFEGGWESWQETVAGH